MPNHRLVGRPRHRAKRQGFWPVRGVRSDAARHRAATAVGPPSELMPVSPQATAKGLRMRSDFGRMIRSALFTPWFAVSAGIVIAASLTLSTHPALTFPPGKSGRCIQASCASPSTAPSGPAPAIKHVVRLPPSHARAKIGYGLLRRNHDHFVAVILDHRVRYRGHRGHRGHRWHRDAGQADGLLLRQPALHVQRAPHGCGLRAWQPRVVAPPVGRQDFRRLIRHVHRRYVIRPTAGGRRRVLPSPPRLAA